MRRLFLGLVLLLAACPRWDGDDVIRDCGDSIVTAGGECTVPDGQSCPTAGTLCGEGWGDDTRQLCTCQGGHWECTAPTGSDGQACPLDVSFECTREGPPACSESGQPSAAVCSCQPGGTWFCDQSCYDQCPSQFRPGLKGRPCSFEGRCTFDGSHECTCANGMFSCAE